MTRYKYVTIVVCIGVGGISNICRQEWFAFVASSGGSVGWQLSVLVNLYVNVNFNFKLCGCDRSGYLHSFLYSLCNGCCYCYDPVMIKQMIGSSLLLQKQVNVE